MADPTLQDMRVVPDFKVKVNGSKLPDEADLDVLKVRVSEYVEGADQFAITLNNWHSLKQDFKYIDEKLFAEGNEVIVEAGFANALEPMIIGEIAALEPGFHEREAPTLTVNGYDRLHRFRRGRKTRSFLSMKDSDVAARIASDLKLKSQVKDTGVVHDYLLQNNLSDIDFLLQRARRIRYEVLVEDKTLKFRPAANAGQETIELAYGQTLRSFYPRLSTMRQVSEVKVQGWDPAAKKALLGKASSGDTGSKMGGKRLGSAISEGAFFKSTSVIVNRPVFSQGEAKQIAEAQLNEMAVQFITGEAVSIGNTKIRAGSNLKLTKLGERFSGLYYVTSCTHIVDSDGYQTRFSVERTAT